MGTSLTKKATLIEVDGRKMTNDARYHVNLLADYVIGEFAQDQDRWIELREAAGVMYHSGIVSNQNKINRKLHTLFNELKSRGYALVTEPTTKAFKIYSGSEAERQYMLRKQKYWGDRREGAQDNESFLTDNLLGATEAAE